MRIVRLCRLGLAFGLALPAILAGVPTSAQDGIKVEIAAPLPHTNRVDAVAFSPDGTRVLSGSYDNTLKLWEAATGQLIRTFEGHARGVSSVAFSPNGTRVLSGSLDNTLKLWAAATGQLIRTFEGHAQAVVSVAFSRDGTQVLSGSADKTLKLWNAASGQLIRAFEGHSDTVESVAFSPDGRYVLSGSGDKTLKLWDAATGQLIRTFEAHAHGVRSVAFSPDGTRLLSGGYSVGHSGGYDKTPVKLWDTATGQLIRTFKGHAQDVPSVAFSPDGRRLLLGGFEKVKLWDAATGQLLRTFERSGSPVAFSPDGTHLLSQDGSGFSHAVNLWDAATGRLIRTFGRDGNPVYHLAYSPDSTRLLSIRGSTLELWDTTTGRLIHTVKAHSSHVYTAAFSPDGTRLFSASEDKTLKLWDAATGRVMRSIQWRHPDGVVHSAAFSPDGTRLLSAGYHKDGKSLKLWDTTTGQVIRAFYDLGSAWSVAFSPDGRYVLSGSGDKTVRLWDASSGRLIHTLEGHSDTIDSVAISRDGTRLLSGSYDKTLKLWNAATGQAMRTFEAFSGYSPRRFFPSGRSVSVVALSPDGTRLLSASYDTAFQLWDAATGRLVHTFEGHLGFVSSVAFSPDGRSVASASTDGTILIWSLPDKREVVRLLAKGADWLALSHGGFFDFRGDLDKFVHLVHGVDVLSIHRVHQSLYNPDLVREALANDPNGEVQGAADVVNLDKVVGSGPAPGVAIVSPAVSSQSGKDLVTVSARIEDRGRGVGRIEWRVNGITAAVAAKPEDSGPIYTVARQLALDPGDNTIEVVAYNASNLLASLPARTTVKFTGPADKTKPKLHILAIGINAYVDKGWAPPGKGPLGFGPLDLAANDARAFADSMEKAADGLYGEVRVTLALDKDATRDNLLKLVDKIAAQVHPRDSFILFAAAHGDAEKGRFYLIPQDYQSGPPGTLARRAIGQDDLQDWLANRIKARRAVILLDTCESGSLIAGHKRSRTDTAASEAGVGRLHEATGRPVLTAAAAGQSALEGPIAGSREGHGYFTWAVLDALHYADTNGNGLIELSELVAHVQIVVPKVAAGIAVRATSPALAQDKQTARFGSRGEDFVIARRLP